MYFSEVKNRYMSIFKSLFGSNKEEKERLKKEKEEKERLQKEKEEKERLQKEKEEKERLQKEKEEKESLQKEKEEKESLQKEKYSILLKELDSDGNGIIDLVEGDDYGKILKLNQDKIIEINRDYIKQFVQISNYLKTKRKSLQSIFEQLVTYVNDGGIEGGNLNADLDDIDPMFEDAARVVVMHQSGSTSLIQRKLKLGYNRAGRIIDQLEAAGIVGSFEGSKARQVLIPDDMALEELLNNSNISEYLEILKDDCHIFNLILVQSITMVQSLINNDMITFYEIYEKLDQLNMFDSKHEKDIKKLLGEVNNSLDDVMKEIRNVGQDIVSSVGELSFITEEMGQLVQEGLDSVNSSIQTNNFLTGVQTYQMYKINQNTKGLR